MSVGNYTLRKTYVDGDILSASDYVADHQQHIDNQNPTATGAYSDNVTQMQTVTDTGDVGSESLASTLGGELERLRFVLKDIKTKLHGSTVAQWYAKSYGLSIATAGLAVGAAVNTSTTATPGSVTISATTETDVVTASSITTRGGTVLLLSNLAMSWLGSTATITFRLYRDATVISTWEYDLLSTDSHAIPLPSFSFADILPAAAAHVYKLTYTQSAGILTLPANSGSLKVLELA